MGVVFLVEVDEEDWTEHLGPDVEFDIGPVLCLHGQFLKKPKLEAGWATFPVYV